MTDNIIDDYALILVYPDGLIDKILVDSREFHMQYYMSLINESNRLQDIIKRNKILLPIDDNEAKYMLTYDLDTILAKEGIIVFHNLFPNKELVQDLGLEFQKFHVTLPSELSNEQKEILTNIFNNNDFTNNWYGKYDNGSLLDTDYNEIKEMLVNKNK